MTETLEERARIFATEAHERAGQKRKYTNEPYITHPAAVVELVRSVPHTEEQLAAAWLHDTVEDTGATIDEIYDRFGQEVARYVSFLTDVSKPSDGTRVQRKAIDREHTYRAPAPVKTVKLADLIDNGVNILERDPEFARVYLAEKALLLEVLREGDSTLWARADAIVSSSQQVQADLDKALRTSALELVQSLGAVGVRGSPEVLQRYRQAFDEVSRIVHPYRRYLK